MSSSGDRIGSAGRVVGVSENPSPESDIDGCRRNIKSI